MVDIVCAVELWKVVTGVMYRLLRQPVSSTHPMDKKRMIRGLLFISQLHTHSIRLGLPRAVSIGAPVTLRNEDVPAAQCYAMHQKTEAKRLLVHHLQIVGKRQQVCIHKFNFAKLTILMQSSLCMSSSF
jgi:hypothetical protein